ncbi:MAG: hypothetical protein ACOCV4_06230 [Myxococcota bacterium]
MAAERVSVEQVVGLLVQRRGRLPFEIGAFVALEACEALLDQGPALVTPADVCIDGEGRVQVTAAPGGATSGQSAQALAQVLARLLVAAGHAVPPALLGLVERGPEGGDWSLARLHDELEASLLPLNRSAARRVLSRTLRELHRGEPRASTPPPHDDPEPGGDVDAELDDFLGLQPGERTYSPAPTGEATPVAASRREPQGGPPEPGPDERRPPAAPEPFDLEPRPRFVGWMWVAVGVVALLALLATFFLAR